MGAARRGFCAVARTFNVVLPARSCESAARGVREFKEPRVIFGPAIGSCMCRERTARDFPMEGAHTLPSVTLVYKRDTFNCTPTCTPQVAAHALSMHASWLVGWITSAMLDGQDE